VGAAVTSKGQVTIPKPVRDLLGIEPGTIVDFQRNDQGEIVLVRSDPSSSRPSRFSRLRGTLKSDLSTDEIMAMLRGDP